MLSLLDIAERSQSGPKMSEMDWDMGLFHKMTELANQVRDSRASRMGTGSTWMTIFHGAPFRRGSTF